MLKLPRTPPAVVDALVRDFTARLREVMAEATRLRGIDLIDEIFASLRAPRTGAARRRLRRADRQRQRMLGALTRQLLRDLERATRLRVREAVNHEWAARAQAAAEAEGTLRPAPSRRRPRQRPLPPPPDPEQLKRDAEAARLRALLRPATEEIAPPPPAPVSPPMVQPQRPSTPGEFLRNLEKEIQGAVPALASLGPERCGAQIAAWAGQVREFRDRLSPELSALMRPAIRIFLEHLTELRTAMDATFVDALDPKWHPPDWKIYIDANRARAEGRPPDLAPDQVVAHHRAMLKALVQPHRRHIPDQAMAVIKAAGEVLPSSDSQLRSAIRRHSAAWAGKARPRVEAERETAPGPADEVAVPLTDTVPTAEAPAATPAPTPPPADTATEAAPAGEDEFDRTWTK